MFTVEWQARFEGMCLTRETHAWPAGATLFQVPAEFNVMQACVRRPVKARLAKEVAASRRLGRIVLTPAGFGYPVETIDEEVAFPVRKFEFDTRWLTRMLEPGSGFDFSRADAQPVFDDPVISATLDRIHDELAMERRDGGILLNALLRVLAIDMARLLTARSGSSSAGRGLTVEQLTQIRSMMETADCHQLTTTSIAEVCGMRPPRLRQAFLATTGTSLSAEIERSRVQAASRQLIETRNALKIISHQLGFTHSSAFCYWFKKSTGLTPTEYRLQHAANLRQ